MVRRALRRGRDEGGFTLVELLVVMVLLSIVGGVTLAGVISAHKTVRLADDQSQGLQDVKNAAERLARDIRDARSVVCDGAASDPTCTRHLQLWIDYNSNYVQDSGETVTWWLQPEQAGSGVCGPTGHCDLIRTVGSTSTTEARTIVQNVAFSYDLQPQATSPAANQPHTTVVNVDMTYDALTNTGVRSKTVSFTARLRNVS